MTIGHSTQTFEAFGRILQTHRAMQVVDVRSVPRSRRNPQFNLDTLPASLKAIDIDYVHMEMLGGLRRARFDSVNTGWHNASFRGFADYMQTPDFAVGLEALIALAKQRQVVIMCAEAVPWRCHRSLIADALLVRGIGVEHIMNRTRRQPHSLTLFARVEGMRITYPPESDM